MADDNYRTMWESLNLDITAHDGLLKVLGKFYNDIYLSQHGRLKGMEYLDFVLSEVHGFWDTAINGIMANKDVLKARFVPITSRSLNSKRTRRCSAISLSRPLTSHSPRCFISTGPKRPCQPVRSFSAWILTPVAVLHLRSPAGRHA